MKLRVAAPLVLVSALVLASVASAAGPPARTAPGAPSDEAWSVAFSPDGRFLAVAPGTAEKGGALVVWDLVSGRVKFRTPNKAGFRTVAYSPDGKTLATASMDTKVYLHDAATGKVQRTFEGHKGGVNGVAFSPDGKLLASAGLDKAAKLWDVATGKEGHAFPASTDWVLCVAWVPGGKTFASAGKDGTVRVWDADKGHPLNAVRAGGSPLESIAASPDGKWVFAGSWDHAVWATNPATAQAPFSLRGHPMGVLGVDVSPDGKLLASCCGDWNKAVGGEVRLWDLATRKETFVMKGHTNSVWCVKFSPGGRMVASAGRDGTVRLWEVETGKERLSLAVKVGDDTAALAPPKEPWTAKELEALWDDLKGEDAAKAYRALRLLALAPEQAAPFLRERLKPSAGPDEATRKKIAQWIRELDDDNVRVREKATEALEKEPAAEEMIREALAKADSPEVVQRLQGLAAKFSGDGSPEALRLGRVVEALSSTDPAKAKPLLEQLAKRHGHLRAGQEAKAALERLNKGGDR